MDLAKLAEPFPADDIEWRIQSSGKSNKGQIWARILAYITNRAIQDRLDEVCGPENWRNEYITGPDGGILCGLSIRCERENGAEWVRKWDGAENTQVEAVKGGLSGAMKRAGAQWGIGRYLYHLPEAWAKINDEGGGTRARLSKEHGGDTFMWLPPNLPAWALPGGSGRPVSHTNRERSR